MLQGLVDLDFLKGLDDVHLLDVVVGLEAQTAVITAGNLLGIILEALERCQIKFKEEVSMYLFI